MARMPDAEKIAPITYDPVAHVYRPLAASLATAFRIGLELAAQQQDPSRARARSDGGWV